MKIRAEQPGDLEAIRRIHLEAFRDHPHSRQTEHRIVDALRQAGALRLSLVAEVEGELVGHVAFSPATVDGQECDWFFLGPIGVLPASQRLGLGSALMRAGLMELRDWNAQGCLLVGNPGFYGRFGFRCLEGLTLEEFPEEFFLGLPMGESWPRGRAGFHPAFLTGS